jgi:kynureninase
VIAIAPESLYRSPNALAPSYSRFRVAERLLLTGHSHQAWPDAAFEGQQRAWLDAADLVDDKWGRAGEVADRVRAGWRRLLREPDGKIALGQNTHELIVRLVSALPLRRRSRFVTTDAEFHTVRRQLDRIAEEGFEIVRVAGRPAATVAERMAAQVDERTACAVLSSVYFETAEIVPDISVLAGACARHGAACIIDAYHHLNVVPFDVRALGLEQAYVVGGGYKYCQLGEGNCMLRLPRDDRLRPVITGWFSEFAALEPGSEPGVVAYGAGPARFAGATYDPTAHYRAAAVFDFHERAHLTPEMLQEVNRHQVGLLQQAFERLDTSSAIARVEEMPAERRGGFLAIRSARAAEVWRGLRERGVAADWRGDVLRLGPAPYLSDDQLLDAIDRLAAVLRRSP